ncbi:phytanoyl-CoA dioxygenase family protein [Hyphobacterium sp.]|uniref:phytanoyl-CoA dioxygenase family protein n=1 Tax=Hyphobacterium sp. TaxID=2004662 RepID=UPI003747E02F
MAGGDPFDTFAIDGYALIRDPAIAAMKDDVRATLHATALHIARRLLPADVFAALPKDAGFDALLDGIHAAETGNAVTRALYEVFPALPPVIALIDRPVIREAVARAGVADAIAGTLPLIRLDRPGDARFATPAHQDSWYSLLSPNAVTVWTPLCHMTPEMGELRVVPGSHTGGPCEFKPYEAGHEWFETAAPVPDEALVSVTVGDDEMLIFNQSLIHKSGVNRSGRVRISVQLRYNDLATAKALTSTYTPSLSAYVLNAQKERLDGRA